MAERKINAVGAHKGPEWERSLSRLFSSWISKGESKDILWRTHGSGGFATNLKKQGRIAKFQGGDLGLLDPTSEVGIEFLEHFVVEAKHLKPQPFWPGAAGWTMIERFWIKVTKEAEGKCPLLVIKINHQEAMVFMPAKLRSFTVVATADVDSWNGTMELPNARTVISFLPLMVFLDKCDYASFLGRVKLFHGGIK